MNTYNLDPFVPKDNYKSDRDSIAFVNWFLKNPEDAINLLDGVPLEWKLLPDLFSKDRTQSVPVRHILYQFLQSDHGNGNFILSFGFTYNRKEEINKTNKADLDYLGKIDPLERTRVRMECDSNNFDTSGAEIRSETYMTALHFAKPICYISFIDEKIAKQLKRAKPILHEKMELLSRTKSILQSLGCRQESLLELDNIKAANLIMPSAFGKSLWAIPDVNKFIPEDELNELYVGKTKKEQDKSSSYIREALARENMIFSSQSSLREFTNQNSKSEDKVIWLNKLIGEYVRINEPLFSQVYKSEELNDTLLLINTIGYLFGNITRDHFKEIVSNTSLIRPENRTKLEALGHLIDTYVKDELTISIDFVRDSNDKGKEREDIRKHLGSVIDEILLNEDLKKIHSSGKKQKAPNRRSSIFKNI